MSKVHILVDSKLTPLRQTATGAKPSKAAARAEKALRLRINSYAVTIQSHWRRVMAGRAVKKLKKASSAPTTTTTTASSSSSSSSSSSAAPKHRHHTHVEEASLLINKDNDKIELERFNDLPFDKVKKVHLCIDGAIGLPVNCTATRVTARVLAPDRTPVGDYVSCGYSFPDSDVSCPEFDVDMSWRGKERRG